MPEIKMAECCQYCVHGDRDPSHPKIDCSKHDLQTPITAVCNDFSRTTSPWKTKAFYRYIKKLYKEAE